MQSLIHPQAENPSLSELEKAGDLHEKHDINSLSGSYQDHEVMTADEESGKGPTLSTPDCTDWDGPDDPDNPHNCMNDRATHVRASFC
jgi:hypothetical protein